MLATKGQSGMGQDQDDTVLIPFTTAERKVLGVAAPIAAAAGSTTATIQNPLRDHAEFDRDLQRQHHCHQSLRRAAQNYRRGAGDLRRGA